MCTISLASIRAQSSPDKSYHPMLKNVFCSIDGFNSMQLFHASSIMMLLLSPRESLSIFFTTLPSDSLGCDYFDSIPFRSIAQTLRYCETHSKNLYMHAIAMFQCGFASQSKVAVWCHHLRRLRVCFRRSQRRRYVASSIHD